MKIIHVSGEYTVFRYVTTPKDGDIQMVNPIVNFIRIKPVAGDRVMFGITRYRVIGKRRDGMEIKMLREKLSHFPLPREY